MIYIGIDPGLTGAIAFIPRSGEPWVADMPVMQVSKTGFVKNALNGAALAKLLEAPLFGLDMNGRQEAHVFIERVNAFPGQGVSSMFSLGMSYWGAVCTAAALELPVTLIEPKDWKQFYRLDKDKALARAMAQRLFPAVDLSLVKHHGRAEALLIAQYGKTTLEGR